VLLAGLAILVVAALAAIVMSGPDSPRHTGVDAPPPDPLPVPSGDASDPPGVTPSASPSSPGTRPSPSPSKPSPGPSVRSPIPRPAGPVSYEAESPRNVLSSGARVAPMNGASGGAGVDAIGVGNLGTLTITGVTAPASGTYLLTVYYQVPDRFYRSALIGVNGDSPFPLNFTPTGSCCVRTVTLAVPLKAGGGNSIVFSNPDSRAPDIDRIVVSAGTG
jgi:Alpha-galactosidase, CBM13 domain